MSFDLLGVTFHAYGFILGIAAVAAFIAIEKKAQQVDFPVGAVWKVGLLVLISGLIGARLWHVATDFYLYRNNFLAIFKIWQGGLSILGGILGGGVGLVVFPRLFSEIKKFSPVFLADMAVFGLPLAQIIGRLANWVNQELYGLPTNLPWKIFIAPENRLQKYQDFAYYHPLFLYEMLFMALFLVWVWRYHHTHNKKQPVGNGWYVWSYLTFYSFVRFFLDFIRIDNTLIFDTILGVNQLILALIFTVLIIYGVTKNFIISQKLLLVAGGSILLVWLSVFASFMQDNLSGVATLQVDSQYLQVELANTPEELQQGLSGRSEIGADGMLFILPEQTVPIFWMKEMQFDLDMVWIRDGMVVDITTNVPKPEPNQLWDTLPRYSPEEPVQMVLEIPAGKSAELGIREGSTVTLVKNP